MKFPDVIGDACEIGARVGQAFHEARGHRIAYMDEDHGNVGRRRLRSANSLILEGDDEVNALAYEGLSRGAGGRLVSLVPIVEAQGFSILVA